jgi:threonyl-tRNA synthetase
VEFKEEHLKELNKILQKIIKEQQPFTRIELNYNQAKEIITMLGEEFKIELIDEFKADGETVFSYYINTIPVAAKDKLLKDSKPGYIEKYEKITAYLADNKDFAKAVADKFVTFIDMCE